MSSGSWLRRCRLGEIGQGNDFEGVTGPQIRSGAAAAAMPLLHGSRPAIRRGQMAPCGRARGGPWWVMDLFEYALRAYNLLLDLVLLILGVFVGPLRYVAIVVLILLVALAVFGVMHLHRRHSAKPDR